MEKKKRIYTPEQVARNNAKNNKWYKENTEKSKENTIRFREKNPGYVPPCVKENPSNYGKKDDLGYIAVYAIDNYNGTEASYCGQTGNLVNRMKTHRQHGRLNTESHRILGCFRTREQAMAFEAIQHKAGYHGHNNGK